ncbi:hypothetical protein PB1_02545 [Bacillus methanolicus PB1]|uniref:Uncharacterized protein n=1 Tax=Bacillus methanolicus PB1 TaxID=997296 RepID=I3E5L1_BACMT|nr:hypothetical protein PB1_02545 [Bacillus methanolicus PB1]
MEAIIYYFMYGYTTREIANELGTHHTTYNDTNEKYKKLYINFL